MLPSMKRPAVSTRRSIPPGRMRCPLHWGAVFTFLDYDGVPWNNNGAENAIKEFATLRRCIGGVSTENGMGDYLILLSIRQTLKRRDFGFLDFLLSGKRNLERFATPPQ